LERSLPMDVLIDRVGGSLVPVFADALHGRQDFDEFPKFAGDDLPGFTNMTIERERLVLGENIDFAQVGIDAIGERDVNDPVDSAKGDGGLCAIAGKRVKPLTCTTS